MQNNNVFQKSKQGVFRINDGVKVLYLTGMTTPPPHLYVDSLVFVQPGKDENSSCQDQSDVDFQ